MNRLPSQSRESRGNGASDVDALTSEFASEHDPVNSGGGSANRRKYRVFAAVIVGALLVSASAVVGLPKSRPDASLVIESDPAGTEVRIDGQVRGRTPLVVALEPGTHHVVVGEEGYRKEHRVTVAPAERASIYHVVGARPTEVAAVAPSSAALSVVTEPVGGRVSIDGVDHGAAPLLVPNLRAGEHRIVVRNQGAVYQQTVTLRDGSTSTVVVGAGTGTAAGWLTVQAPLRLQIHEVGRLLGSTDADRLMLPAGEHQITFSDEQLGFRVTRPVRIVPGDTTNVVLQVPRAPVNVNATPWADVWVNNERVGETPIGNYLLPLGSHQVELRHPQLGTKRMTIVVSLNESNRLAVNMREQ